VTADDAHVALTIYGPDIAHVKGKTTKTTMSPRVPTFEAVTLPAYVVVDHRNVTLCVGFLSCTRPLFPTHYFTRTLVPVPVSPVPDPKISTILREIRAVIKLYESRGLHYS
jgi:hypothetical protein